MRQEPGKRRTADLAPIIGDIRATGGTSLHGIATGLNGREIPTAQGGTWSVVQVQRVLDAA
ncbi:recombinase family protein [Methylobacterium soli]|uniref:Recombinase domain-containing protein n=1 Tax=Methylobacterium soli TaxID=553447 RepID=A0A6L3SNJ8_9HYPH|nr:recombinase family protein [Methylobacterium soli]KAB1069237.1 hypothetical protein F6X53_31140 [Methylobacterium soli]